ncbi:GNAT family N-acetyltransferase [Paenibacillus typhae]|uniref:Ribosomal-protein-alanine N-acetyltransferase n=1 Tax=Paenibacillus typhae TaxID=1174501 RepID=A0A1G8VGV7_9BACL|nr:GNAT family N-acetyltransferase [Paenibacillus typhae]SDJ65127.1 ribosomal-protein-alanine N-acetyltransferase [Paenibacillus typhae]
MIEALSVMHLETERLIIRPYIQSDLQESFELMQDPEVLTYMHMDVFSAEDYQGVFDWLISSYGTPFDEAFKYSFAIREKESGAFIGWCGVGTLDFCPPDKELYYLIGRQYWGRGYAAEAAAALAEYSFGVIGLDRLYAKADPRNTASVKILGRLGFKMDRVLEGLTGDYADCNGEEMYVLTREQVGGGENDNAFRSWLLKIRITGGLNTRSVLAGLLRSRLLKFTE